ncbi:peptidase inhibitor family I36 protein [Streptomyces sp. DH37]|uniref:peptidase inhibitor family I36 protein n=1 Tax=Streptomyces sp. DH37 TaxID=3040122 RepID=UPI00244212C3|nr:peptidase inhibitor family I36 protein [Streptomyces sp. DH37]MDG9701549.1 peptidase inhibitor family I36 protein [Streptomyces sp. DH37]
MAETKEWCATGARGPNLLVRDNRNGGNRMKPMTKTTKRTTALLSGMALAIGVGSGAAVATDRAAPPAESVYAAEAGAAGLTARQAARLQDRVDARLADLGVPALQVNYNEIRTEDGSASITLSSPGAAADSSCSSGYLCLWSGDFWDGDKLSFYKCAFRDLSDYGFNDRLTSYKNNQSSGTRAKFYNWQGSWVYKFDSHAYHTEDDLQNTPWDNMIDGVRVC